MSYDLNMLEKYSRPSYMKLYYEVVVPTVKRKLKEREENNESKKD